MKKLMSLLLSLMMILMSLPAAAAANAQTYEEQLKSAGFTDAYIEKLAALHKKHPNWRFEPMFTGQSFSNAVKGERSKHSKQIIESGYDSKYYCSCSKCRRNGKYISQYPGCYSASQWAVEYYMNPLNWLDESHVFQFESNRYNSEHTQYGVETILKNTWMYNSDIAYTDTEGHYVYFTDSGNNHIKYSKAITDASKAYGVNTYYIASRIVKEVGSARPSSTQTSGKVLPFTGMYNYYSIGATSGGMSGLEWASGFLIANKNANMYSNYNPNTQKRSGTKTKVKSGQRMSYLGTYGQNYKVRLYSSSFSSGAVGYIRTSAVRTTYFNYFRPWTNPYRSIFGGAKYIADNFVKYQYTSYLEKFNVNPSSNSLYEHEYMQNVTAPSIEAVSKYNAYKNSGQLEKAKTFYIPVYSGVNASSIQTAENNTQVKNLKIKSYTLSTITVKWSRVQNANRYYVKVYNLTKGTSFSKKVKKNSAKLSGLSKGNVYKIRVKAKVDGKWCGYSEFVKARCKPSKIKLKKASSKKKGQIKTSWKKQNGVSGYQIVYSKDKNFKNIIAKKNVKKTSYTRSGLKRKTRCYVKVRAYININGKKYYGKYSSVKSVAVK